ncbi:hypothetical protein ACFL6M_07800 [Candidatus Eisenbacteria bacterium]|uniref:Uncharacterized protein n=1 Tax=Eiseniibacteriota bacterium TaxID=2212470 RepID=A0ABV6YMB9_UNCEI
MHVAVEGRDDVPVAPCHKQTVEIALGPKGAFGNGNIGALARRVPANHVVSAVPPSRGKAKPPRHPKTPRVVELLRKAIEWRTLLDTGEVPNQADIARREGTTRAQVTQVMCMLRLAPEIQQHILSIPNVVHRPAITERSLQPISQISTGNDQLHAFRQLLEC